MLFSDSYQVITKPSESIFKDRGSKFYGYAYPIQSENEVKPILETLKKEHTQAIHFCYAYRLGADKQNFRINDDGEPAGTAGKPIYNTLLSFDVTNCFIVVVRYFGGTLLGVSGLIHAYKTAAIEALEQNTIIEKHILYSYLLKFGYEDQNAVSKILKDCDAEKLVYGFDDLPTITCSIKKSIVDKFEKLLKDLYKVELKYLDTI
jgi:uncharacterized YigZ family protein